MAEEYGMKVWLELAVKNAKDVEKSLKNRFKNINLEDILNKALSAGKKASGAAQSASAATNRAKMISGLLKTAGVMLGVLYLVAKTTQKIFRTLVKHSPYLQGIMSVMGRAWGNFWRPFGDFLANMLRPLAIALLKLSVKWLKFTRTPAGEVTTKGVSGMAAGAGIGAVVGGGIGIAGGPLGVAAGAGAGAIVGGMVGGIIALLGDAWKGLKNIWTIATAWLDELLRFFGIDMDKVRVAVVTFLYRTLPEFFTEKLPKWFNETIGKLKDFGAHVWEKLTNSISDAWIKLKNFGAHVWSKIKESVSDAWQKLSGFAQHVWDKMTGGISNVWNKLRGFAGHIWDKITGGISNLGSWLRGIGSYMYERVTESIKQAFSGFKFGWSWWWQKGEGNQRGLDHVPNDGLYKLHRGEKVVTSSRAQRDFNNSIVVSPVFNISTGNGSSESEMRSQVRRINRMLEFDIRGRSLI